MILFLLLIWGPSVLGAVIALALRLTLLRGTPRLPTRDAVFTAIAGGVPVIVFLAPLAGDLGFGPQLWWDLGSRTALPLILGIVGVILLCLPSRSTQMDASAQLVPRTVRTFLRPRQPILLGILAAVAVILALAAGAASETDERGQYTQFSINLGTSGTTSASTGIYGWHYSLPALALLGLLLLTTAIGWLLIPRPAWSHDIERDTANRRLRAANIARIACGAVLLHLAVVFSSLRGTASMMLSAQAGPLGMVSLGTPFAAMEPALFVAWALSTTAGIALWLLTALSGVPMGARTPSRVRTS
ncbi:hypothetical protein [Microbacterium aurugineum]|uniref:Uncharacterized protein n=1 Tax=Microbacterium aurugineum TaxID=2851642 RepID=A0ABY4J1D2_9MICO|nr:hypothetical protein [Microbacterium aurugineum]UPL17997.1 hypothetical protein KV397_09635 [Microbacterium aurugineum]